MAEKNTPKNVVLKLSKFRYYNIPKKDFFPGALSTYGYGYNPYGYYTGYPAYSAYYPYTYAF